MAYFLDESKIVNDNINLYEQRLNSQYTRFLEKTQTFVTYYNVNMIESTADSGFEQVERVLGDNSPVRYNKINKFPIYGLEQIVLDLENDDHGMDSSYEGEAVILPNTVKPKPHDMFVINHVSKQYLFMVTNIAYDTIKSNNYYKINFVIKSLDQDSIDDVERQTTDSFTCIFANIGTQEKWLIRDDDIELLTNLNSSYTKIAEMYKIFFYNKKYNCFMFTGHDLMKYYDRYNTFFINKHELFNQKNNYATMHLHIENMDATFMIEYHGSVYRALELNRKAMLSDQKYQLNKINTFTSIFTLHRDRFVSSVKLSAGEESYIDAALTQKILDNLVEDTDNVVRSLIVKYFNGTLGSLRELPISQLDEYFDFIDNSRETYVLIPILLYIIRSQYNKFMSVD